MELFLLDADFNTIGILDNFESLEWNRQYYGCGDFSLNCSTIPYSLLRQANYICRADRPDIGIIDGSTLTGNTFAITGKFAKYLMSRRVMYPTVPLIGNAELLLRDLVQEKLGIFSVPITGREPFGEELATQKTGGLLLDWAEGICRQYEFCCDIRYDYFSSQLQFVTWRGLNRTQSQSVNTWAVFSPEWENLSEFSLVRSDRNYKTAAIVAGMGRGKNRVMLEVDLTGEGEDRREMWVDARDLQQGPETSYEDYLKILRARGLEKLAKNCRTETFTVEAGQGGPHYLEDYDLGDLATVRVDQYGITSESRITGIREICRNGGSYITLTFEQGSLAVAN